MRTDAVALLNTIAGDNPNSEYEKRALLTLFYSYFGSAETREQAGEVLQRLQARYADDEQVKQAAWVYGTGSGSSSLGKIGLQQEAKVQPTTFALDQNYPNPFNPSTTIRFALPSDGVASLKVYDLLGREVASLVEGFRTAGAYEVQLNASSLASGVYVYKLTAGRYVAARKLIVAK